MGTNKIIRFFFQEKLPLSSFGASLIVLLNNKDVITVCKVDIRWHFPFPKIRHLIAKGYVVCDLPSQFNVDVFRNQATKCNTLLCGLEMLACLRRANPFLALIKKQETIDCGKMESKSPFHELTPDEVPYRNPFVHRFSIPPLRRFQVTCSLQTVLLPLFNFFGRLVFFFAGFQWITTKGTRASPDEAPIIVLAPHSSFFDSLLVVALGLPSVVGKTETANSPIGCLIKMTQPILVNRDDPSSRQNTLREINRRSQSNGEWPQILIFPEGTCTNRSCLINYKQGTSVSSTFYSLFCEIYLQFIPQNPPNLSWAVSAVCFLMSQLQTCSP
ncbi:unnamed protein product [Dibothriocephalus latus]|uniref:Phospholipid/glycerol acyltransferase domain-containing protein n=1 Tax=Dibothriocephalus latus TaxID=60516 RepID=A0A3P7LWN2_DIBLA|nr:unnamed protein product [Dibothriocephalus latus]